MKGFSFTSLLIGGVLLLLVVSTVLLGYFMYSLANSTKFEWGSGADALKVTNKDKALEAIKVWEDNKIQLIIPTVSNVLAMVALSLLYVMG